MDELGYTCPHHDSQVDIGQFSQGHCPDEQRDGLCHGRSVALAGCPLRTYDLANLPPGFSEDEIVNIALVDNIRQGDIFVFFLGRLAGAKAPTTFSPRS